MFYIVRVYIFNTNIIALHVKIMELPIYFVNKRSRYGYRFTEMFSELVPVEDEIPLEPIKYSTDIMLAFLDLSLRCYGNDSKKFETMVLSFANQFGPLKYKESTYLEDFNNLAASMSSVTKNGRREINNRTELSTNFTVSVIDSQVTSGDLVTFVEMTSLGNAIWFDFLMSGTQGYRQCEFITLFNEKRKNCKAWICVGRSDQKWCSDACRMSAKRRLNKLALKQ